MDDDLNYPRDIVESLATSYRCHSEILCRRAHEIPFTRDGQLLPYLQWRLEIQDKREGPYLFPTSGGGVLYPPKVLAPEVLNEALFQRLAPTADDVWLFWMGRLAGRRVRRVGSHWPLVMWPGSDEAQLAYENNAGGGNDRQIAAMLEHFGSPFDTQDASNDPGEFEE